jgi:hypothetical protein
MRKYFLYFLLLLIPVLSSSGSGNPLPVIEDYQNIYTSLNLSQIGLSKEVFLLALKGYKKLESIGKLQNAAILTIADFSQSSKKKRLYVIDLVHKTLLFNTYVAHGKNTGEEYAKKFSNVSGSYQSSLGFYVTKEQISGASVGLSLILEGMEKGFNDNAIKREIIIHGAAYATESFIRKTGRLGRSFGCPSLPPDLIKPVVSAIKEGTCLFIYQKDDKYISHSALLN